MSVSETTSLKLWEYKKRIVKGENGWKEHLYLFFGTKIDTKKHTKRNSRN